MEPYVIPEITVPIVPVQPWNPPTRGMSPVLPRGLKPPTANVPEAGAPTINLPRPPISNPDPGKPKPGASEQEEQEETTQDTRDLPDIPMAPFDASTEIQFTVPIIEQPVTVPVPKPEVVITAGTTAMTAAVTATGAAIFAKPLFEQVQKLLKPLAKKVAKKLLSRKDRVYPPSVDCTLPDQLRFEHTRLTPSLIRQHRDRRKEKKGGGKPQPE